MFNHLSIYTKCLFHPFANFVYNVYLVLLSAKHTILLRFNIEIVMEIFQFINISEYFIDILYITEELLVCFFIILTIPFLLIYAKLQ